MPRSMFGCVLWRHFLFAVWTFLFCVTTTADQAVDPSATNIEPNAHLLLRHTVHAHDTALHPNAEHTCNTITLTLASDPHTQTSDPHAPKREVHTQTSDPVLTTLQASLDNNMTIALNGVVTAAFNATNPDPQAAFVSKFFPAINMWLSLSGTSRKNSIPTQQDTIQTTQNPIRHTNIEAHPSTDMRTNSVDATSTFSLASSQPFHLDISSLNTSVCSVSASVSDGTVTSANLASLTLSFQCVSAGVAMATASLRLDGFQTLNFAFWKECLPGKPMPGFYIATDPSVNPPDVVVDGVATTAFSGDQSQSLAYANAYEDADDFFASVAVGNRTYRIVSIQSDRSLFQPTWAYANEANARVNNGVNQLATFVITYNCISEGNGLLGVTIDVGAEWSPVYFAYMKQCDNENWRLLLILVTVCLGILGAACIAGCFYNYTRQRKRGMDVVPCYGTYRKCVECCYKKVRGRSLLASEESRPIISSSDIKKKGGATLSRISDNSSSENNNNNSSSNSNSMQSVRVIHDDDNDESRTFQTGASLPKPQSSSSAGKGAGRDDVTSNSEEVAKKKKEHKSKAKTKSKPTTKTATKSKTTKKKSSVSQSEQSQERVTSNDVVSNFHGGNDDL